MELLGFIYDFIIPPIFLMYIPKKTKFKKEQKKISFKKVERPFEINKLQFGSVGLKSVSVGRLTSKQIDSISQLLKKKLKRIGQIFITISPNTPITKKPIEVRMGKGKGNVSF
jgi:large subunit ribosomal protein L16